MIFSSDHCTSYSNKTVPNRGIHQQDLVSLGEANKDYKANGKVHWKKFRLIGDSILQVMRFQYPTYTTLVPDSFVIYFIGHEGTVATEDVSNIISFLFCMHYIF